MPYRPQSTFPPLSFSSFLSKTPANALELQHSGEEYITGGSILEEGTFPSNHETSRSQSRAKKVKKSTEFVQDSDEEMDEIPVVKAKDKGKKKATEEDEDYMEVDELDKSPSPIQGTSKISSHGMVKRSLSRPPVDDVGVSNAIPARESCESCTKKGKECMFDPGVFACMYCCKGKMKCLGVPETWRSLRTANQEETQKSRSRTRSSSKGPTTTSKKPRGRSMSRGPIKKSSTADVAEPTTLDAESVNPP
jgi:hypothetical protein